MSDFISCYNEKRELEHFKVPEPIFVYIRQLEDEINYGMGGVQRLYPDRFGGNYNIEDWGIKNPIVPDETMEELLKNGVKNEKL
jgi:hypothetical protein